MYFHDTFTCYVCIILVKSMFQIALPCESIGIDVIIVIIHFFLNQLITFQVFFKDTHNWRYLAIGLNLYICSCMHFAFVFSCYNSPSFKEANPLRP